MGIRLMLKLSIFNKTHLQVFRKNTLFFKQSLHVPFIRVKPEHFTMKRTAKKPLSRP